MHHPLADGEMFTRDQLEDMKKNPFVSNKEIQFNSWYIRDNVVCIAGGIVGYKTKNILEIKGERVIGLEPISDENGCNYDGLNLLIRNSRGDIILEMENNDWIVYDRDLYDVICPPKKGCLKIILLNTPQLCCGDGLLTGNIIRYLNLVSAIRINAGIAACKPLRI
jgi:hypothetical protein